MFILRALGSIYLHYITYRELFMSYTGKEVIACPVKFIESKSNGTFNFLQYIELFYMFDRQLEASGSALLLLRYL